MTSKCSSFAICTSSCVIMTATISTCGVSRVMPAGNQGQTLRQSGAPTVKEGLQADGGCQIAALALHEWNHEI